MKIKLSGICAVAAALISGAALADYCSDVRNKCNKDFEHDMAACGNYTDRQAQWCYERAHEQLVHCVTSANCGS